MLESTFDNQSYLHLLVYCSGRAEW